MFLPMIDLDPSGPYSIYTTMKFVSYHDATPNLILTLAPLLLSL